jgi:outer membrane lipoprotein LolB
MRLAALAGALALPALLTACATAPRQPPELFGRLAVRVEAHLDTPARNLIAQFELRGDAQNGDLQLTTPIGSTAAQIRWRPGLAELNSPEGARAFATLDELAQELLGEPLPLAALFEWLRGRPWPSAPSAARDGGFDQLGWRVDLTRFAEGWVLASRERAPAASVRARLERPE